MGGKSRLNLFKTLTIVSKPSPNAMHVKINITLNDTMHSSSAMLLYLMLSRACRELETLSLFSGSAMIGLMWSNSKFDSLYEGASTSDAIVPMEFVYLRKTTGTID